MNKQPLLICMTPIRNEAWVLHAFLKATSLWADYIIIADQESTDGSREIALSYSKVIMIENNKPEYNESERQKLLVGKAREIEGDKILFGLDSDEIFAANFTQTDDWFKIINSKPGDVFFLKWAEICPNKNEYWESNKFYPWIFHDDGIEPHENYAKNIHSMRIPYPSLEKQIYYINDFRVLHLAYLNIYRVDAKRRFYKFIDWEINHLHPITYSRSYAQTKKECSIYILPSQFLYNTAQHGFNLLDLVDLTSTDFWFDQYLNKNLIKYKSKEINKLDIWDKEFLEKYHLIDPRTKLIKLVHTYLNLSKTKSDSLIIRIIDKLLIKFGF